MGDPYVGTLPQNPTPLYKANIMVTRYDQKTKDEVVTFIVDYNAKNGRGGQSAAAKKWQLNPITIKSWMVKAGVATPGKTARKKVRNRVADSASGALKRMMVIQEKIDDLLGEYEELKAQL